MTSRSHKITTATKRKVKLTVALDEIPTATCEPSAIATWKGMSEKPE